MLAGVYSLVCAWLVPSLLCRLYTPQEEAGVSEMSDWDRYASDQYEVLLFEEAHEQENEYISFPSPILVLSLRNCVTHCPPRFEDEGENGLKEDKNEMLALLR